MISLLLPTLANSKQDLDRLFASLENQTNQAFELIIVSQANHDDVDALLANFQFKSKHIKINQRGLSHARNVGLQQVEGKILTFTDDDCWYKEDAFSYIHRFFEDPSRQIACFQHKDYDKDLFPKPYPTQEQINLSKRRLLQQASIDIFVHMERVPAYKDGFDETFGLGTTYKSGEENIYLMDLKNKGYRIDYVPVLISYHPIKETLHVFDRDTLVGKGPLFKRLFGLPKGLVLLIAFLLKNSRIIKEKRSVFACVREFFTYTIVR
ncbi:glycosyltransferase family 2 protein [Aquibacillus koreensis]|uniref:Glycosyltransferase family 2 protein n=1 Tax=Aquibacillus koreensis TaxID=279446 RepID=A0A9X3WM23_9BACI|nr:glycosyltransferase family 2 protein [Aquibacillus koreensis]MCT2535121.1 glycosyltransferase family 2 protein [Aquibacillus koreensis]MDC3419764.1 glycosyltransferase family 2 protein [Aquibacillus koreensis]